MQRRRTSTLRFLAEPSHVNFGGKVHGGSVMKWIDQAGYSCAAAWTGDYCVTVYVGGIHFLRPIQVGEVVELQAKVVHTGNTSLHIAIDVLSGDVKSPTLRLATHCVVVFVALDPGGKPHRVPEWIPQTEEDRALEAYAMKLIALRKTIEREMQALRT